MANLFVRTEKKLLAWLATNTDDVTTHVITFAFDLFAKWKTGLRPTIGAAETCLYFFQGRSCQLNRHCKDRSLKCCNQVCRKDSCLGSACNGMYSATRTCGWHRGKRMACCSGRCDLSCRDKPCLNNNDCGGRRSRMKCCDGICKQNCLGSPCFEHSDCQSRRLDCCGFFENKTCARSCLNYGCSLSEMYECGRQRYHKLFCCGDGTCRRSCEKSICYRETFRYNDIISLFSPMCTVSDQYIEIQYIISKVSKWYCVKKTQYIQ